MPKEQDPRPAIVRKFIDDADHAREYLRLSGRLRPGMNDHEVVTEARLVHRQAIPAPAIPAGTPPVSARLWLSDALVARGYRAPEDPRQRAVLDDGETIVDLSVLAALVVRHLASDEPAGWDDGGVARMLDQPQQDVAQAQELLEEVALDVGVPAPNGPCWWWHAG